MTGNVRVVAVVWSDGSRTELAAPLSRRVEAELLAAQRDSFLAAIVKSARLILLGAYRNPGRLKVLFEARQILEMEETGAGALLTENFVREWLAANPATDGECMAARGEADARRLRAKARRAAKRKQGTLNPA